MITQETVKHVAQLARLEFSENEERKLAEQLGHILAYIEQLQEVDTQDIEPTAHALSITNVLREDKERPSLPLEKVLANAPSTENGMFQVPRILE